MKDESRRQRVMASGQRIAGGRGRISKMLRCLGGPVFRNAVASHSDVKGETVKQPLRKNVDTQSMLNTDASPIYARVGAEFARRETVDHSKGEYVRGDGRTNTIEGYLSQLKRSVDGTRHHV